MKMNKLGVLGGMGPFATSVFFERVIEQTEAYKDQDHIDMMILNHATLPDRTESIINNDKQPLLQLIEADLRLFEQAGVKNIAIPCNTTHYFYDDIQRVTKINIIHMVKSTVKYIDERGINHEKVAVLATDGTVQSNVYEQELQRTNIEQYHVDMATQRKVMDIIYHVKGNIDFKTTELDDIIAHLVHEIGCTAVILACTELSTIKLQPENQPYCVDALDILVQESIIQSGKKIKRNNIIT